MAEESLLGQAASVTVGICSASAAYGGPLWGSGFFAAPGWVLTCAHVLADGYGRRHVTDSSEDIGIVHGGKLLRGRLEYGMPGPRETGALLWSEAAGHGPYEVPVRGLWPDLALIRLLAPVPDHPCAWLGDRSTPHFHEGYALGGSWDCGGGPGTPSYHCSFAELSDDQLHLGTRSTIAPGTSGGPLLDAVRGEVIGVVKGRSLQDTGGVAVPLTALRELGPEHLLPGAEGLGPEPYHALMGLHDEWHSRRQGAGRGAETTWADVQRTLPVHDGKPWSVLERLTALRLLGTLPAPRDTRAVETAVGEALGLPPDKVWRPRLRTWRDGHGALYSIDGYAELRSFVQYLLRVAREVRDSVPGEAAPGDPALRSAERLAEWAEEQAGALAPADRHRIRPLRERPSSILVELEPLAYGGDERAAERFTWSVLHGYGTGQWRYVAHDRSAQGAPFAETGEAVLRMLGGWLRRADEEAGRPVRLEVALPDSHLAAAVHQWPVPASQRQTARRRPVGALRPVVLRDVARRAEEYGEWTDRWRAVSEAGALEPLRIENPASSAVWRLYAEAAAGAVPVLCHTVADGSGRETARAALDSGYAVALWRSDGHEEAACGAECEKFHQEIARLLEPGEKDAPGEDWEAHTRAPGPPGAHGLPERVRQARERAESGGADWAHGLVLLYDDPRDPLPERFGEAGYLSPR